MADTIPHDGPTRAALRTGHTVEAIRSRLHTRGEQSHLRDFVYGALDGAVTTLAVVLGGAGAELSPGIVVILGGANLIGDGFSMAAGNFLGTRSDNQLRDRLRRMEERHIDQIPEGEREEVRQILQRMGFQGQDLDRAVEVITSDRQRWVDTMLKEEHGLSLWPLSPWRAALATFVAFILVGLLPLAPFLANIALPVSIADPLAWSVFTTGTAFFIVGTIKSRFVQQNWCWSGLETLLVGGAAASLAYLCGLLLKGMVV